VVLADCLSVIKNAGAKVLPCTHYLEGFSPQRLEASELSRWASNIKIKQKLEI